jgi:hypothetical protein
MLCERGEGMAGGKGRMRGWMVLWGAFKEGKKEEGLFVAWYFLT